MMMMMMMMMSMNHKRRCANNDESNKLMNVSKEDTLNDDSLLDIFVRLPDDCRAVIRCSVVCKHWFSLINSIDYDNRKRQRQSESSLPFTIIFRRSSRPDPKMFEPFYEYLSEKSLILHGMMIKSSSSPSSSSSYGTYLEFLPWRNVHIYSSFNDLLLLSPDPEHSPNRFVICNPLTRQCLELPPLPPETEVFPFSARKAGLVCKPSKQHQLKLKLKLKLDQYNYRVMGLILATGNQLSFSVMIFSSETGEWSRSTFGEYVDSSALVPSNGMLHWLEMRTNNRDQIVPRIIAFDPFQDANDRRSVPYHFIDLPSYFQHGFGMSQGLRARLGLVRGKLRLSQLNKNRRDDLVLKVWELNYDDNDAHRPWSWTLVHYAKLRRWTTSEKPFFIILHPENEDVIFLLSNCRNHLLLYQYDIGEEKMTKIGEIPEVPRVLQVCTLVHPLWPTTIPMLPSL